MDSIAPEAFTLAEAVSDRDRASRASRLAIDANFRYGVPSAAEHVQCVERADRYAEPDTTERVLTDIRLARLRANQGKLTEARALTLRALELARKLEDHETLYRAARGFLYIQPSPRHEEERLQLVREMSAQSQAGVIAATLGTWLGDGAGVLIAWGDRAGAEAMWEQHSQLAQRTSDAALVVNSLVAGPKLAYLDGGLDEAVSGAKDLTRTAEELGSPVRGRRFAAAASWRPLLYLGRGEEALSEAAELAGSETAMGEGVRTGILIRAHLGQTAEAGDDLRSLLAEPRLAFEDENFPTTTPVQVLEAAVLVGDRDLCSVLAERLAPAAHLSTASWGVNLTCPARHLGAAAALLDEPDKARKHYHQAFEAAGKIRFRPEIALTYLQLSELLLDHYPDERTEALEHLDFAIGELRDMKMQPSLERAFSHRDILKA
jgi:tetratricopeptide (TPR) repeat protein